MQEGDVRRNHMVTREVRPESMFLVVNVQSSACRMLRGLSEPGARG